MIADVFIKRKVTAIVASIVIVILGVIGIAVLPVSQFPNLTPATASITASFTGADAESAESNTTTPIEVQVNGTPGMDYIKSNSGNDGSSAITVMYDIDANSDIGVLDVQNRVGIATPILPDVVKRLGVTTLKKAPTILMVVSLYSPKGTHSTSFVDNYTNIYIRDALLRVKGIGDVASRSNDFSVRIWLNLNKIAQLGITPAEITTAIQLQNQQVAAGSIGAAPQQSGQIFEFNILTNGRLTKPEEFGNIIIRNKPSEGSIVYLKDIARIELGMFSYKKNNFVNGKQASLLILYQTPGSNALITAKGVYKALETLKQSFPQDLDYVVPFETVSVVTASINEVLHTFFEALILVVIVTFLFLQSWRATLIAVIAIPVSIIGTFAVFIPLGFSINTLTLFGMILAIGIVVDDAIVVVEAVQHNIDHEKMSPKAATTKAMKSISAPVIAIALILAAVFVPAGFIPGIVGRIYKQFSITIAVSVLISAFVALSLTPALCVMLLRPSSINENAKGIGKFFHKFNLWFANVTRSYGRNVQRAIRKAPLVIIFLVGLCVVTIGLFKNKPTGFLPLEDEGRLYIVFELPESASATRMLEVNEKIIRILQASPLVKYVAMLGGYNILTQASKVNAGAYFCSLKPWDERKEKNQSIQAFMKQTTKALASITDAKIVIVPPPPIAGLGNASGVTFELEQQSSTDNISKFETVTNNFVSEVLKRPEIASAFTFFTAQTPAYKVDLDRQKCAKEGVSIGEAYSTLQLYLGSSYINDLTLYGRPFHVVAMADTIFRGDISRLNLYYVKNQRGSMVPLSSLIHYRTIQTAPMVQHFNLFRSSEINAVAKAGYSTGDVIKAMQEVAAQSLPTGYGYEFGGITREEVKAGSTTILVFTLSVLFVFLFLAALYESWSIPFSVLFAVPIGAFGSILTLTLIPTLSNNVYAQIGLITLIGLSAKNAILIVEYAKERLDSGAGLYQAILKAVSLRFRPIIMTSAAFILGVLPLALASGAAAVSRATIGWAVFGGMLAATMMGVFVVPVLFVLIVKLFPSKKNVDTHEPDEKEMNRNLGLKNLSSHQ